MERSYNIFEHVDGGYTVRDSSLEAERRSFTGNLPPTPLLACTTLEEALSFVARKFKEPKATAQDADIRDEVRR